MTFYDNVIEILRSIETHSDSEKNLLPTELFNEGWLLRLVLDWFSKNRETGFVVSFNKEATWFSEGRLETIFKKERGLKAGEGYTEADGVFGNITVGMRNNPNAKGIGDIRLTGNCRQFVAIEAKIQSKFSEKTTNSGLYPQPARYIACMSYVLSKSKFNINNINDLAFYTFLPEKCKHDSTFQEYVKKEHIRDAVKNRVQQFKSHDTCLEKEKWYDEEFMPFLDRISIALITWEEILEHIKGVDNESFVMLNDFYLRCKLYNHSEPGYIDYSVFS
jgi:hypothetical protein